MEFIRINNFDGLLAKGQDNKKAILVFHGFGASANDLAPLASVHPEFKDYDWYFLDAPHEIALGMGMVGRAWFPLDMMKLEMAMSSGEFDKYFASKMPEGFNECTDALISVVNDISEQYETLCLSGFSQGSMVATHLTGKCPGKVQKLALFSSSLVAQNEMLEHYKNIKELKIFQTHGVSDPVLPISGARALKEIFEGMPHSYDYFEFNGGHEIPFEALNKLKTFFIFVRMVMKGTLLKMKTTLDRPVTYKLPIGDELVEMNPLIGKNITLKFTGNIYCISTGEKIKKSYNQGFSYKAFMSLAACDICIVKPNLCHYHKGTCREPEWGENNCMIPHIVYLSNTSKVKIGITRETQVPTRWIDQGAMEALPILRCKDRYSAGLIEAEISKHLSDKTNWRNMLKGDFEAEDLEAKREGIFEDYADLLDDMDAEDLDEAPIQITYPVEEYPEKVYFSYF